MTIKRFYRRRFLNGRGFHAGAYVIADCQVEAFRRQGGSDLYSVDASIAIADCGRVVTLDFSVDTEPAARNALRKARLLHQVIGDFVEALEADIDEWREVRG